MTQHHLLLPVYLVACSFLLLGCGGERYSGQAAAFHISEFDGEELGKIPDELEQSFTDTLAWLEQEGFKKLDGPPEEVAQDSTYINLKGTGRIDWFVRKASFGKHLYVHLVKDYTITKRPEYTSRHYVLMGSVYWFKHTDGNEAANALTKELSSLWTQHQD